MCCGLGEAFLEQVENDHTPNLTWHLFLEVSISITVQHHHTKLSHNCTLLNHLLLQRRRLRIINLCLVARYFRYKRQQILELR